MKQLIQYLFGVAFLVLVLSAANAYVSAASSTDQAIPVQTLDPGSISARSDADHILSLRSEEMILPSTSGLQSVLNQRRAQYNISYLSHPTGRTFSNPAFKEVKDTNRSLYMEYNSGPVTDPSLEYVFKLRRILI